MSHPTFRALAVVTTVATSVLATGCGSITGLDGQSSYSCKAPDGVRCDSVSGNYHNAIQNNLPSQRRTPMLGGGAEAPPALPARQAGALSGSTVSVSNPAPSTAARTSATVEPTPHSAAPLRASPRVMRLWIKPWEDADRDLNGEAMVYVQVDNGRWLVDHVQRQAREPYAPVRPQTQPVATSAKAGPAAAPDDGPGSSITKALRALQQRDPSPSED